MPSRIFKPSETVDFVVVGSGAAGGVMARELAQAGFSVVVLEQGPRLGPGDFEHDELKYSHQSGITNDPAHSPQTFRVEADQIAQQPSAAAARISPRTFGASTKRIFTSAACHPDDLAMAKFLQDRSYEILEAAGAQKIWRDAFEENIAGVHLLGTARMGNDPASSVVDKFHRTHDVPNLFLCDGSSFVTSGRGQPTMTIQALALRAADHIGQFARRNEI